MCERGEAMRSASISALGTVPGQRTDIVHVILQYGISIYIYIYMYML